jgi:hypothetical protein
MLVAYPHRQASGAALGHPCMTSAPLAVCRRSWRITVALFSAQLDQGQLIFLAALVLVVDLVHDLAHQKDT